MGRGCDGVPLRKWAQGRDATATFLKTIAEKWCAHDRRPLCVKLTAPGDLWSDGWNGEKRDTSEILENGQMCELSYNADAAGLKRNTNATLLVASNSFDVFKHQSLAGCVFSYRSHVLLFCDGTGCCLRDGTGCCVVASALQWCLLMHQPPPAAFSTGDSDPKSPKQQIRSFIIDVVCQINAVCVQTMASLWFS